MKITIIYNKIVCRVEKPRNFSAAAPNQKWVTDVTAFHLFGQKLYLSPILGLHSQAIVSYTISERPVPSMVTSMLEKAFAQISDDKEIILHSDQGWQYQHKQYQQMLRRKGICQSMSRKGNPLLQSQLGEGDCQSILTS